MIARMKKIWLVVLDAHRRESLHKVRELGLLHIVQEEHDSSTENVKSHLEHSVQDADKALGILSTAGKLRAGESGNREAGARVIEKILENSAHRDRLVSELSLVQKEIERVRDWGEIDPDLVKELKSSGRGFRFFSGPAKRFGTLPETLSLLKLSTLKGRVYFAIPDGWSLQPDNSVQDIHLPADFYEFVPSDRTLSDLTRRLAFIKSELLSNESDLVTLCADAPSIRAEREHRAAELRFESVRTGMHPVGPVACLSGYIPATKVNALLECARQNGWGVAVDEPSAEDQPPTKVENNTVVRIVEPVFEFLGTVPHYREYDISGWFLGFFALYFAMIFGDGGYGIILLSAAVVTTMKMLQAKKPVTDTVKLLYLLAGTTITWGALTGTWFAIPTEQLPGYLAMLTIPAIRGGNPDADTNIKIFCFVIGAIQLSIAHIKNIVRDFPNLKFLAQIGSLGLVAGMFMAVLNLVIDPVRFPIPGWSLASIGIGFLLIFIFGSWEGNLIKSILDGFKGIIPTFLGMVSVFADIVSYIRLWAVGLAGLAISQTVNGMATGMFGEPGGHLVAFAVGSIFGIILLCAGHALNLVMSVLSVVVHGIRLNMLEFSGHLGMEWSGYKYDPLREKALGSEKQG